VKTSRGTATVLRKSASGVRLLITSIGSHKSVVCFGAGHRDISCGQSNMTGIVADDPPTPQQKCGVPSCNVMVHASPRYPNYVCSTCATESPAVDADGNPIDFFNIDGGGGFISVTTVGGEKVQGDNHVCYIRGVKCRADEARFGGIVVLPAAH